MEGVLSRYQEAWQWIERNPGTSSASGLVKLILSLWNQSNAFSLRECIDNLDGERAQLALRVAIHFANYGEDRELVEIGYKARERYPRLWELGQTAWNAKCALQERWRIEDARVEQSGG